MKIFFPKTLLSGLTSESATNYVKFFSTHALLKSEYCIDPQNIASPNLLSSCLEVEPHVWDIHESTDSIILTPRAFSYHEYECHVSDSLWGTWWHNAHYPTLSYSNKSSPQVLLLPFTFGSGSSSIDLVTPRVAATENLSLISSLKNLKKSSVTTLSTYTSNQISSYSLDIASSISYSGYRFTNNQYRSHRSRKVSDSFTIAVIGGSAAFCDCSPDTLSFPSLLEDFLNLSDPGSSYRVFNFGQIGATLSSLIPVVSNEVIPLRPDLIISYAGYNEIRNSLGQFSNFDLSPNAIPHAHSSYINKEFYDQEPPPKYSSHHLQNVNANQILSAITDNHRIHRSIADLVGSKYLAAIQPISYFNQSLMSSFERSIYLHYSSSIDLKISYQKVHHLLSKLPEHLKSAGFDILNVQELPILQSSRSNALPIQSLFHDTMHQSFNLEPFVALALAEHILKRPISHSTLLHLSKLYQFPFLPLS